MKLKKIVSLALAGVLAVSMLAGCATKAPTQDDNKTEVETTSLSDEIGKLVEAQLGSNMPTYVSFKDNASVESALKRGVQAVSADTIATGYMKNRTLTYAEVAYKASGLTNTDGSAKIEDLGSDKTLKAVEDANATKPTAPEGVYSTVYNISTAIGEDEVKAQVAKLVADGIKDYQYTMGKTADSNANFTFTYTVSVSACTKTVNSSLVSGTGAVDPALNFVAIQIVRTATHQ